MFRSNRDLRKIQILPKASNSLETQGAAMGERQGLAGTRHAVWVKNGKAATSEIRLPRQPAPVAPGGGLRLIFIGCIESIQRYRLKVSSAL